MPRYLDFQSVRDLRRFDTLLLDNSSLPSLPSGSNAVLFSSESSDSQWRVTHHPGLDLGTRTSDSGAAGVQLLRDLGRSTVYRCYLHSSLESPSPEPPIDIVCKIFRGDDGIKLSRNEYACYNKLHFLQGNGIPSCYGLFEGELDGVTSSCLVLQFCGNPLQGELWRKPWPFKEAVISLLETIHHAGIEHNNFNAYSILTNDYGNPTIINFASAQIGHNCPARGVPVEFHKRRPSGYPCDELCEAADLACAWIPSSIRFNGRYIRFDDTVTAEMLAEVIVMEGLSTDRKGLVETAKKAIQEFHEMLACRMELQEYHRED